MIENYACPPSFLGDQKPWSNQVTVILFFKLSFFQPSVLGNGVSFSSCPTIFFIFLNHTYSASHIFIKVIFQVIYYVLVWWLHVLRDFTQSMGYPSCCKKGEKKIEKTKKEKERMRKKEKFYKKKKK